MSPAKVSATVLPALLVVILSSACFGQPSRAVVRNSDAKCLPADSFAGANEQTIPASFPTDFPVYPAARFVAATHSTTRVTVTWTSTGAMSATRDFYEKQLQSGDWQLFGDQGTDPCGAYWHVERRSNPHYGGFVSVHSGPNDNGTTFINALISRK